MALESEGSGLAVQFCPMLPVGLRGSPVSSEPHAADHCEGNLEAQPLKVGRAQDYSTFSIHDPDHPPACSRGQGTSRCAEVGGCLAKGKEPDSPSMDRFFSRKKLSHSQKWRELCKESYNEE